MQGHKSFKAIAVATDIKPGASPCGMCRQLYVSTSLISVSSKHWEQERIYANSVHSLREFNPNSFPVYMYDKDGEYKLTTIGEVNPPPPRLLSLKDLI